MKTKISVEEFRQGSFSVLPRLLRGQEKMWAEKRNPASFCICQVHSLDIDLEKQKMEVANLQRFDQELILAYKRFSLFGILYDHYFVTDGKWTIEFRGDEVAEACVHVHCRDPGYYDVAKVFGNSEEVLHRMRRVCGARSFSFCFRNCEHVARYIAEGRWFSAQSAADGSLWRKCMSDLAGSHALKLNKWPWELESLLSECCLNDCCGFVSCQSEDCYVVHDPSMFNVLVIGAEAELARSIAPHLTGMAPRRASPEAVPLKLEVTRGSASVGGRRRDVQIMTIAGSIQQYGDEAASILRSHLREDVICVDRVLVFIQGPLSDSMQSFVKLLGIQENPTNFTFIQHQLEDTSREASEELLAALYIQVGATAQIISTPHLRPHGQHCLSLEYLKPEERPSRVFAAKMGLPNLRADSGEIIPLLIPGMLDEPEALAKLLDATFLPCEGHFLSRDWRLQVDSSECLVQ